MIICRPRLRMTNVFTACAPLACVAVMLIFYHQLKLRGAVGPTSSQAAWNSSGANKCTVIHNGSARVTKSGSAGIPVLGLPVLSDPELYLLRLLYSIDFPIRNILVVYQPGDAMLDGEIRHIIRHLPHVSIVSCTQMLGCSEAWNYIIQKFTHEPWYMISAYDVQFTSGALRNFYTSFIEDANASKADIGQIGYVNMYDGGWNVFALTRALVERAGLFDENIFPAYYEDDEYRIRLATLKPPGIIKVYSSAKAVHGAASNAGYISGISSISDAGYLERLLRGRKASECYLRAKWNVSSVHTPGSPYMHPFNNKSAPASYWVLQPVHRRYVLTGHSWEDFIALYPQNIQ